MDVVKLVFPAAAFMALAGGFFGVVLARACAAGLKVSYEEIWKFYKETHETDQSTIATMQRTIDLLRQR